MKKITFPNIPDIKKTNKIAAGLFGIDEDKTQVKPTLKTALKLISIEKNNFICLKDSNEIISWSVVLPTSKKNMKLFLAKKINEKTLFDISLSQPFFEALYLTAVIVLPKYQRKGIGSSLMKKQIEYFKKKYGINSFYSLVLTKEGKGLIKKIELDLHIKIKFLSRV